MIFHEIPQKPFVEGQKVKDDNGKIGSILSIYKDSAKVSGVSRDSYIASHGFATTVRYITLTKEPQVFSLKQLLCGKVSRIIPI
jgi:hypothetical protein